MLLLSHFSRVQLCATDPMDCSTPGLPVHHQLPELAQTHVHWVGDATQPSHPLSSPSPPAFNLSKHQGLFQWVSSSYHQAPPSLGFSRQEHCHFLLQCMKVKSESEVAQSCLTLRDPIDCSPPGSSIHAVFQARVLEWGAIGNTYKICTINTFQNVWLILKYFNLIIILMRLKVYKPINSLLQQSLEHRQVQQCC